MSYTEDFRGRINKEIARKNSWNRQLEVLDNRVHLLDEKGEEQFAKDGILELLSFLNESLFENSADIEGTSEGERHHRRSYKEMYTKDLEADLGKVVAGGKEYTLRVPRRKTIAGETRDAFAINISFYINEDRETGQNTGNTYSLKAYSYNLEVHDRWERGLLAYYPNWRDTLYSQRLIINGDFVQVNEIGERNKVVGERSLPKENLADVIAFFTCEAGFEYYRYIQSIKYPEFLPDGSFVQNLKKPDIDDYLKLYGSVAKTSQSPFEKRSPYIADVLKREKDFTEESLSKFRSNLPEIDS